MQISREQIASGAVFCRLKIRALSFSFRLCEKKRGKKALLFNCAVANSIHRPMFLLAFVISLAVSISQIKKSSRFSRLFSKPVSNRYSLDRFIDSFEFLNNKEYLQIIFRTRSSALCSNDETVTDYLHQWEERSSSVKSGLFDVYSTLRNSRSPCSILSSHRSDSYSLLFYIYIYSRGDFTCSLHRVERCYVARCAKNWLPVTGNLDYTADILQIPE